MDISNKYNLCSNQESCLEESYNETIRYTVSWDRYEDRYEEMLTDKLRSCSNVGTKEASDLPFKFWKRQLSRGFANISPMPCPILSTLAMQRYDINFCFECHSSNTLEDWIEGHTRAMNIIPTLLQGNHTSNCIHNAKNIVKQSLRNFSDIQESKSIKGLFHAKVDAMKGKVKRDKWLSTEGIDTYKLNDEKTDTMIIHKVDEATNYANIMTQAISEADDEEEHVDWKSIERLAMGQTTLTRAAHKLEEEQEHNVQTLSLGCIDLHRFLELARQDYLVVDLETAADRLNAAIPTEITTLVLAGFGLLNAIELVNILLKDAIQLIKEATFYAPKSIDIDYGRIKELDEREIRHDCINYNDYETECGTDEDEDSTGDEGGMDTEDEDITAREPMARSTPIRGAGAGRYGR